MPRQRDPTTGRFMSEGASEPPRAARSQLGLAVIRDVLKTWSTHGPQALVTLAEEDPTAFVKLAASLLPKEVDAKAADVGEAFTKLWRAISDGGLIASPDRKTQDASDA